MEKAIKYDYIYNAVDELFKKSWAAEYSVYKRVLNIIANAPTTDAVEVYCKNCKFGDWDSEPDCYGAVRDSEKYLWYLYEDEVKPLTNADRIRAMSDEELAKFMESETCDSCREHWTWWLEWLQQPAEEDFT